MSNKPNRLDVLYVLTLLVCAIIMCVCLNAFGCFSSSHSSSKWDSLSDTEKANAEWAYNVQQAINGK